MARMQTFVARMRRKNANHPDLITGPFEQSIIYPPPDELIKESGKMQLLERMLKKLHAEGHKVRFLWRTCSCDLLRPLVPVHMTLAGAMCPSWLLRACPATGIRSQHLCHMQSDADAPALRSRQLSVCIHTACGSQ